MRVDLAQFEERYRHDADPWDFSTSPYEQHKYATTVSLLPRDHYRRAFEPGCSIGALTVHLATVVDEVIAIDPSPSAIDNARRLATAHDLGERVRFSVGSVPEVWPEELIDLLVWSEIGYYWDEQELAEVSAESVRRLRPGTDIVAVHWLGTSPDHLLVGDVVHEVLLQVAAGVGAQHLVHHRDDIRFPPGFVLDVWRIPE